MIELQCADCFPCPQCDGFMKLLTWDTDGPSLMAQAVCSKCGFHAPEEGYWNQNEMEEWLKAHYHPDAVCLDYVIREARWYDKEGNIIRTEDEPF